MKHPRDEKGNSHRANQEAGRRNHSPGFRHEPTRDAALKALANVNPTLYDKSRNFLDGAVTGLSPWLTHGFIDLREATRILMKNHPLGFEDKIIFEFAWREFFKHVHGALGSEIFSNIRKPVWPGRYQQRMPTDIVEGRTGVQAIDEGVAQLYSCGYLHNHVRMWIASYTVHVRKVHWKVGADWMYAHLLDGDLASNHLSWQWVAGTFSHKPYVFNAENVHRYARHWNCRGTAIDTDYDSLDQIARSQADLGPEAGAPNAGEQQPAVSGFHIELLSEPLRGKLRDLRPGTELKQDWAIQLPKQVLLIHPWDLGKCTGAIHQNEMRVGLLDIAFHQAHPWSVQRWNFVLKALGDGCEQLWIVDTRHLGNKAALFESFRQAGTRLSMVGTLNPGYEQIDRLMPLTWIPEARMLPNPAGFQQSFSRFYKEATRLAGSLEDALAER